MSPDEFQRQRIFQFQSTKFNLTIFTLAESFRHIATWRLFRHSSAFFPALFCVNSLPPCSLGSAAATRARTVSYSTPCMRFTQFADLRPFDVSGRWKVHSICTDVTLSFAKHVAIIGTKRNVNIPNSDANSAERHSKYAYSPSHEPFVSKCDLSISGIRCSVIVGFWLRRLTKTSASLYVKFVTTS